MNKPISILFKTSVRKLRIGEHEYFYSALIAVLNALVGTVPSLVPIFTVLKNKVASEAELYKIVLASALTPELLFLHRQRISAFGLFKHTVGHAEFSKVAAVLQAHNILRPLVNTYKNIGKGSYMNISGMFSNFIIDCEKAEYSPFLQTLALILLLAEMKNVNNQFKDKFIERAIDKENVSRKGSLASARTEVDGAFEIFIDAINSAYLLNELGAKDPTLRANLTNLIVPINAELTEVKNLLAHRGHHKPKDDGKEDGGTQTPITPPTPPPPPETGTQNPNTDRPDASQTTQNPTDEPHHLDPNEHPAMGE
ncbi:MAG: DUF6261 family protein [Tannerellaceae bacterium]|jgi:hypothetical protein|nr:DUF6261 family protein [Tannerellaceae bacterium]